MIVIPKLADKARHFFLCYQLVVLHASDLHKHFDLLTGDMPGENCKRKDTFDVIEVGVIVVVERWIHELYTAQVVFGNFLEICRHALFSPEVGNFETNKRN